MKTKGCYGNRYSLVVTSRTEGDDTWLNWFVTDIGREEMEKGYDCYSSKDAKTLRKWMWHPSQVRKMNRYAELTRGDTKMFPWEGSSEPPTFDLETILVEHRANARYGEDSGIGKEAVSCVRNNPERLISELMSTGEVIARETCSLRNRYVVVRSADARLPPFRQISPCLC